MPALRCIYCERRWPRDEAYIVCPCCREKTVEMPHTAPQDWDKEPLTVITAARLKQTYDFGWWLWLSGAMERGTAC